MIGDRDLGPLPAKLAALVAAERRAPAAPVADRARVWAAIVGKLPPPGSDGGPGDPGAGGAAAGAATAKSALPWIGGVAAAGAAIVAIVVATRSPRATAPPPPSPPVVTAVAIGAPPDAALAPAPDPAPEPATVATRDRPPRVTAAAVAVDAAPAPAPAEVEDVLIERARISLVRARFDEALTLLAEHETRFPRGAMRGERELLYVRALLGTSNRPAAEARAAKLRAADPDNASLPAIEAALAK